MQAAKYFTFIFFGLSVFVILLFGGFVVCHCYRRLRYAQEHPSGPQVRAYYSIMDLVTAWQACPAKLAVSGSALLHQTLAHHIQHTEEDTVASFIAMMISVCSYIACAMPGDK